MTGPGARRPGVIRLFLGGDVMTGRGIDQILAHPGDPVLFEGYMTSALGYVDLAERRTGPLPRGVAHDYVWGALIDEFQSRRPDLRLINLETAVTVSDDAAPKGINYRMNPANGPVLAAAGINGCMLANNHVLDWGASGLAETLATLDAAGIGHAGAGRTGAEAAAPLILAAPQGARAIVVAIGCGSSGIPQHWGATAQSPGVALVPEDPAAAVAAVRRSLGAIRSPGDILAISVHWGGNWGYEIPPCQRMIAHALIDEAGATIVYGHSSHHPKAVELHRGRPILYGCGDLLNDYEGIAGHEQFRGNLALAWFADIEAATGALAALDMVPFRIEGFRLVRPDAEEIAWIGRTMQRECGRFGRGVSVTDGGALRLLAG